MQMLPDFVSIVQISWSAVQYSYCTVLYLDRKVDDQNFGGSHPLTWLVGSCASGTEINGGKQWQVDNRHFLLYVSINQPPKTRQ